MTSSMLLEALPPVQGMAGAIDLDITALISLAVFVFAALVLKFALIDPYVAIVEERERRIDGAKEGADELIRNAQEMLLSYEAQLATARRDAMDLRTGLRTAAEENREAMLASARDQAASELAAQRAKIDAQMQVANTAIEREAQTLSEALVARVLNTGA